MANTIEEAWDDWLHTQTAVTSLADIYPLEAFDAELPYITMFLVSDPNLKQYVSYDEQGAARIQHNIWTWGLGLGLKIRAVLRQTIDDMHATSDGYEMYVESVTEQTMQRTDQEEPHHFVVDAVVRWRK